jgi:diguanylate cyclase (GGDEF)-like protein
METYKSAGVARRRLLFPSFVAALLPFALIPLPPGHWHLAPLLAAAALTIGFGATALVAPWQRLPGWAPTALAFAYLAVTALLRDAGGASGVAPVVLVPVFWVAASGTPRQLMALIAGIAAVLLLPVIVVGGASYPAATWRAAVLFIVVSGLVGWTIQTLVAHAKAQELERDALLSQLDHLARTDPLTQLPNRRAWDAELDRALARSRRTDEPVTVAVIDVDGLKAINDAHGHPEGDAVLAQIARNWRRVLRPDDVLARIGGDEFALLLPSCSEAEAADVIERLRERIPVPHSCSVGLAAWNDDEPAGELMRRADHAMYRTKREGRQPAAALA